jgi:hypothetical protein
MKNPSPSRRTFLRQAASLTVTALPAFLRPVRAATHRGPEDVLPADRAIIQKRLAGADAPDLLRLPVGDLVAAMGRSFLGGPYRANTLEQKGGEHLVVDLREFDCVTFCEASLALARALKLRTGSAEGYCAQLRLIRYRSGVIDGYGSRLHYFSDWIADNEKKKVLRNITAELGGRKDDRALNFMSSHRDAYPSLSSERDIAAVVAAEKSLSAAGRFFVPKENVEGIQESMQSGDIIAITTSVEGLDVSHTGIALREGGVLRLLHAPNAGQKVQLSRGSLAEYLNAHEKQTGIMVARPVEPAQ